MSRTPASTEGTTSWVWGAFRCPCAMRLTTAAPKFANRSSPTVSRLWLIRHLTSTKQIVCQNSMKDSSFALKCYACSVTSADSSVHTVAGPSDALLTAGNLTAGQNFDSGNVCANSVTAFVYIKNDCILPARAVVNMSAPFKNALLKHTCTRCTAPV